MPPNPRRVRRTTRAILAPLPARRRRFCRQRTVRRCTSSPRARGRPQSSPSVRPCPPTPPTTTSRNSRSLPTTAAWLSCFARRSATRTGRTSPTRWSSATAELDDSLSGALVLRHVPGFDAARPLRRADAVLRVVDRGDAAARLRRRRYAHFGRRRMRRRELRCRFRAKRRVLRPGGQHLLGSIGCRRRAPASGRNPSQRVRDQLDRLRAGRLARAVDRHERRAVLGRGVRSVHGNAGRVARHSGRALCARRPQGERRAARAAPDAAQRESRRPRATGS